MRIMLETWDYNIVNNDFKWPGQSDLKEEKNYYIQLSWAVFNK